MSSDLITAPFDRPPIPLPGRRRWWQFGFRTLLFATACSAVGMAWCAREGRNHHGGSLIEPVYRADAWLRVSRQPSLLLTFDMLDVPGRCVEDMIGPELLSRVLERSEIASMPEVRRESDPVVWLSSRVSLCQTDPTNADKNFTLISFEGPNSIHTADIVNAIVEEYLRAHAESEALSMQHVIVCLERRRSLERAKLFDLQSIGAPLFVELPLATSCPRLAELENQIIDNEVRRILFESYFASHNDAAVNANRIARSDDSDQSASTCALQIVALDESLNHLRAEYDAIFRGLLPQASQDEMNQLLSIREVLSKGKVCNRLDELIGELRCEGGGLSPVQLLRHAEPPQTPVLPFYKFVTVATAGFFLPLVIVALASAARPRTRESASLPVENTVLAIESTHVE